MNEQAAELLKKLQKEMDRAAEKVDADAIHDLRVAIRRFTQCLRVFPEFFPRRKARQVRKRLKRIMDLASEVRDRDIALELLRAARPVRNTRLAARLRSEREDVSESLLAHVRRIRKKQIEV